MHRFTLAIALAMCATLSGSASRQAPAGPDATLASIRTAHDVAKGYVTKALAMIPQDKLAYQPTDKVRTMGQLFGHIANASGMICGMASGTKMASSGDAEKLTTKADLQKALEASLAFCDKAFASITATNANEPVELFGMKHTRIGAMAFNNAHNFEHYGNIVTYMRINGMVPPSSGGGGEN
jgi:uncharacterized damage-inducible protein DinB